MSTTHSHPGFQRSVATFGLDFHIIILVRAAVILFILILLYPGVARLLFGTSLSQDTCPIKRRRHNVHEDCVTFPRELQRIASKLSLQLGAASSFHNIMLLQIGCLITNENSLLPLCTTYIILSIYCTLMRMSLIKLLAFFKIITSGDFRL